VTLLYLMLVLIMMLFFTGDSLTQHNNQKFSTFDTMVCIYGEQIPLISPLVFLGAAGKGITLSV